ncbi:MAG: LysR family transcriptional regulator [Gammaproteobacteria bacterium]|jgi:DNA-binding transcriptional LysR family regulator|nr:LysR family transcriptional regulator [Gammaproteobacteria bacterium]MBU0772221.1 LysR family transcriptional regulator [Gammaproteobacteria bacterium]MBU0855284.1 LysR family transcriptional regulator [Gammaproteobacteria bacterium]MBU1848348.1 LysR family transcriptional regulator [Gammaproteobacteria bacterium]
MMTRTEDLLAYLAVVDGGSLTAAAEQLGQTVSGVSRALARLERRLGSTLLVRTTRRIDQTEEGRLFAEHARRIVAAIAEAEECMTIRHQRPAGRLRVDAATPFVLHVLVPRIGEFRARYPDVELELYSNERITDLIEQRIDVALRIGTLPDSTLHARLLGRSMLRVMAAPAYLAAHGVPADVAALSAHRLLGFTAPAHLNTWPLRHGDGEGCAIRPALSASSGETVRQLALAGEGIACLSDFMTADDLRSGRLVEVLAGARIASFQPVHAVYYRNTGLAARIACFIDFLAQSWPAAVPYTDLKGHLPQ